MTLRARLTWILLAVLLPLGVATAAGLYSFVRLSLYARLDDGLAARAEALQAAVKWHDGSLEFDLEDAVMPQYQPQTGPGSKQSAYFEVRRLNAGEPGAVIARSSSLGSASIPCRPGISQDAASDRTENASLSNGAQVRLLTRRTPASVEEDHPDARQNPSPTSTSAAPDPAPEVLISVAVSRETVDGPLNVLAIGLFAAGAALAAAASISLRWAVAKGLAPVNDLAGQVARIDADRLAARLTVPRLPPEIAPIQDRVNALLARVQEAMQRERRFTSAAAHELRTPIAELRMLLEVAASQERTSLQWTQTADRALSVLARAQSLCESLLRLSRAGVDRRPPGDLAPVDINAAIDEQAALAARVHGADPSLIRVEQSDRCVALADDAMLASILKNLLDNALRHGAVTADTPVRVKTGVSQGRSLIDVANPAPGLAQQDAAHLFEPLWRKDPSRQDQRSFGLGLAVARSLARAMGGDLTCSLDADRTLRVRLELEAAPSVERPSHEDR